MIHIREIQPFESLPAHSDWALIERANGKVAAKGALRRGRGVAFGPALFPDFGSAIHAAKTWAAQNGVAVVYVRDLGLE